MLTQEEIRSLPPGLWHTPMEMVPERLPELTRVLNTAPVEDWSTYTADVKVHMLMPNEYPSIPNWHWDFVPRNEKGKKVMGLRDPRHRFYLLISGPPITEFMDGRQVTPWEWVGFSQYDKHRCTMSTEHTWRLFIRLVPRELCPPALPEKWERRHSQVYLDVNSFEW